MTSSIQSNTYAGGQIGLLSSGRPWTGLAALSSFRQLADGAGQGQAGADHGRFAAPLKGTIPARRAYLAFPLPSAAPGPFFQRSIPARRKAAQASIKKAGRQAHGRPFIALLTSSYWLSEDR